MKLCAFFAEVILLMAILVTPSSAREYTPEEKLLCDAKGTVVAYVYTNRDVVDKAEMFERLDYSWKHEWSSLHYATYVDLRRIVNDAFRRQGDRYRREACKAGDTTENSKACKALVLKRMTEECREALGKGF